MGALPVRRVHGNAALLNGWSMAPGPCVVHSGTGKNATDMLLCIEAMELFHTGQVNVIILVASDRDYAPLALHLHERGFPVGGMARTRRPRRCDRPVRALLHLPQHRPPPVRSRRCRRWIRPSTI